MLIGAHVSPAGGPARAVERGTEKGCEVIQIFNQSPRAWRPGAYAPEAVAAYHAALEGSGVQALLIHAVYLLNPASDDLEIRAKTLASLIGSLRAGDALGAVGVVLHPGSAKAGEVGPAIARAGAVIREALQESERCPLHLENTAGAGGTLGRSFEELAALLDAAGGDRRLGICLDSCHLYVSGVDVGDPAVWRATLEEVDARIGLDRLRALHVNDAAAPLGSNRDRHANVLEGELGERLGAFLADDRVQGLPAVMETPGPEDKGPDAAELQKLRDLHARWRRKRARGGRT
jgi:deoxyribonuclease-4